MSHAYALGLSLVQKLQHAGFTAYFAGGWVRDFLMNHPSDDIDIATNASVEEIQKLFSHTIPVGIAFGIIIVVLGNHQFEVATFRKEREYQDGRRPLVIERATPEEDAKRRDFTVNGMFYDPIKEVLIDYVNGQEDLKRKTIRAIGTPHERFMEDRLRMIRAVRYSARFHFAIDPDTLEAIKLHAHLLFPSVAIERVWNEFQKMAKFPHFGTALCTLHRLGLLGTIFPLLKDVPIEDIQHRVSTFEAFPRETPVIAFLLELFPAATLEEKLGICTHFKLSNKDSEFVRYYDHAAKLITRKGVSPYELAHLYAHPHFPLCLSLVTAHLPEKEKRSAIAFHEHEQKTLFPAIERIIKKTPLLTSSHLFEVGVPSGKLMGQLLLEGEKLAINERLSTPEEVVELLKKLPLWPFPL